MLNSLTNLYSREKSERPYLLQQWCSNDGNWLSLGRKYVLLNGIWQRFSVSRKETWEIQAKEEMRL